MTVSILPTVHGPVYMCFLVISCSPLLTKVHVNCAQWEELSEVLQSDGLAVNNTYRDGFCFEHAIDYELQTQYNDNRTVEGTHNAILVEQNDKKEHYEQFHYTNGDIMAKATAFFI